MRPWLGAATRALLEVLLPSCCVICGRDAVPGRSCIGVPGLRWCDAPQLCRACKRERLTPAPATATLGRAGAELTAAGGRPTSAALVDLVSVWKYRGIRGLAWPLAELADAAWPAAVDAGGPVDALVPIPLHARRRRARGFNQAELLAGLIGARRRVPVRCGLLRRRRATAQQAKLPARSEARDLNVRDAFVPVVATGEGIRCVGLVDDIVTSGATALAAAAVLREGGLSVAWILSAGLARGA